MTMSFSSWAQTVQSSDSGSATATLEILPYVVLSGLGNITMEYNSELSNGNVNGTKDSVFDGNANFFITANTDYKVTLKDVLDFTTGEGHALPASTSVGLLDIQNESGQLMIMDNGANDLNANLGEVTHAADAQRHGADLAINHPYAALMRTTLTDIARKADYSSGFTILVEQTEL